MLVLVACLLFCGAAVVGCVDVLREGVTQGLVEGISGGIAGGFDLVFQAVTGGL
jgi:hypothetical protein